MSLARRWAAARAHRAVLLPLGALALLVVSVLTAGLRLAGAPTALRVCLALLLPAAAGAAALGHELGQARRTESGIAALRGARGLRLGQFLLTEAVVALVLGAALGWPLGRLLAGALTARTVPAWTGQDTAALLGVLAALVLATAVGSLAATRVPLWDQLRPLARRRRAGNVAVFVGLVVLTAAALAGWRARSGSSAEVDWLVAAGPATWALLAGVAAVALARLAGRLLVGVGRLAGWLGGLGAARRHDAAPGTVLVTAGLVAALLGGGHLLAAQRWVHDTAALAAPAGLLVTYDGDAVAALQLTRELDPEGRYLMAAQTFPDAEAPQDRVVLLDLDRYGTVLAPELEGTEAGALDPLVDELRGGVAAPVGTGDRLRVRARLSGGTGTLVGEIDYVTGLGTLSTVAFRGSAVRGVVAADVRVPDCARGCRATHLRLQLTRPGRGRLAGADPDRPVRLQLDRLELAGEGLAALPVRLVEESGGLGRVVVARESGKLGFRLSVPASVALEWRTGSLPVATTPDLRGAGTPQVPGVDGDLQRASRVGTVAALPFVQASGQVADLGQALLGAAPTSATAQVHVLVRPGTPRTILTRLDAQEVASPQDVERRVAEAAHAEQAALFAAAGLGALLCGAVVLLGGAARGRARLRQERADLLRAGVPAASLRTARRLEVVLRVAVVLLAAVVGWLLTDGQFGGLLDLVRVPPHGLPLPEVRPW